MVLVSRATEMSGLVASKLFHFEERKFENLNVALMRFEWEGSLILLENREKQ